MTLVRQLAWRYLRGKRSGNAVPVLSRISMAAIAVGAAAMVVLFSVFNGFEHLIKDLYKAFYPPIKITAAKGKFFALHDTQLDAVRNTNGVQYISRVIEDNVWLTANDEEALATLKGIDAVYAKVNELEPYVFEGNATVSDSPFATTIVGLHIANKLGLQPNNVFSKLQVYYPNPKIENPVLNPTEALQSKLFSVDGVFRVQDEFDSRYVIASLSGVQSLFLQEGRYSSLEISTLPGTNTEKLKELLQKLLGSNYVVATRFEQNRTLYMVMKTEKWAVYAILLLVLIIASFNMVGALTLLVIEKQKDIAILKAMGATGNSIRKIFFVEGVLWALIGGGMGILIGTLLCLGQQHFEWIRLQGAFIIEAYPVAMKPADVLLIIATVVVLGLLAAWYPARRATKVQDPSLKAN
ncbi:MAG TPA: FtsX-like permease family protein [Flavipsychrobacter sp.]|nr:FtsX-like permease family protein [Flavipsychrobacter sp.]